MRSKKKLTKRQVKIRNIMLSGLAIIIAVVTFFEFTVKDRIELSIIAQIKSVSSSAVNDAVADFLESNTDLCNGMIVINCDNNGYVRSVSENMHSVNTFKTTICKNTQDYVDKVMKEQGINVQFGNFVGLTILSDFGPYVHIDIDATSNIQCEISSTFESVGMNQTFHKIGMELFVDIYVGNPFRIESVAYSSSYEISQTIIVGNIPTNYGTISRY